MDEVGELSRSVEQMRIQISESEKTKRENMKEQIFLWSKDIPMIRANLFGAISRNLDGWKKGEN